MNEELIKKIAKYEEQITWLKIMLKETEDNLFCAKAELEELKMTDNVNHPPHYKKDLLNALT